MPVPLSLGQILGISKELSMGLNEITKQKNLFKAVGTNFTDKSCQVYNSQVHELSSCRQNEVLIQIEMTIQEQPVNAIVDTGSQFNLVNADFANYYIRLPVTQRTTPMNDINGGISYLKGLIQDVPLACDGVKTCTDLYIAEKVPFNLLLGRPWQKGSCISIDERPHGTYLIFKDPSNYEITSELLVSPTHESRYPYKQVGMLTVAALTEGQNLDDKTIELLAKFVKGRQDLNPDQNSALTISNFDNSELKAIIDPLSQIYSSNGTVQHKENFEISRLTHEEISADLPKNYPV